MLGGMEIIRIILNIQKSLSISQVLKKIFEFKESISKNKFYFLPF